MTKHLIFTYLLLKFLPNRDWRLEVVKRERTYLRGEKHTSQEISLQPPTANLQQNPMKPPPFKYHAPTTLDEALSYFAEYGDEAKPLAGGQSLIPAMNFRLAQPELLIDLNNIPALAYIRATDNGGLSIGAMTRQRQVERSDLVAKHAPLISSTMPYIAHIQIRNRGTFGGSLAHADPSSELPAVALVLDASFHVQSQRGRRTIPAKQFFTDLFETALAPDELLIDITIPAKPARTGYAFDEVARRHGDYALVGATAVVTLDQAGACQQAQLVFLSVGPRPVAITQATSMLHGQTITPNLIDTVAEAVNQELDPPGDIHASVDYRRHLAKVLARRVLTVAVNEARDYKR
ncbi:xanthine dehydrogenase family protein subunit M [Anaerolineales bacterium HSG24]|nr:xanthine dehydrogenase family protein subunit M [Anaerolineales bacterium HSG24]